MSDGSSDTKALQLLLENISTKINNSPVLNGGFDRMMLMMTHVQEKQQEQTDKIDNIHDGLYDPKEGLYTRVKMVETASKQFFEKHQQHIENDEKNMAAINESLKKLAAQDADLVKKAEVTAKLKTIAGDDLQKLNAAIQSRTKLNDVIGKFAWLAAGGVVGGLVKLLWELITTHH